MTDVATRPPDGAIDGITFRRDGLEITRELPFNEWRRFFEKLLETTDRAMWSLGDARLYAEEHYAKDYHDALEELDGRSRLVAPSVRVARAFPAERRRQLTFEIHEVVAGLDEAEQERWLDDAARQGWSRQQTHLELGAALERVPVPSLTVKAVGELQALCVRAAEHKGMDPREWAMAALERAAREALLEEAA